MDVLVIDRESLTNQLLTTKLEAKGHKVIAEPNKNIAFDLIREQGVDCILVDPAPLPEARPVVIGIWKNVRSKILPYVMLLSKTATTAEAIMSGTNDVLNKPLSSADLVTKMENADRLLTTAKWLAHEDNVHSAGGMIGKAAFYQLFLSANDRAFRYGERSLIVFVTVTNQTDMEQKMGPDAFEEMVKKFTTQMTYMRRQSDVVGRLSAHDFGILLQRPQYENEPLDAINRFAETLEKFRRTLEQEVLPDIHLKLIQLPQGALMAERFVPLLEVA